MLRTTLSIAATAALALTLAACSPTTDTGGVQSDEPNSSSTEDKLQVVTTFSILGDIVNEIGGDAIEMHSIVPLGVDPHEYAPLPLDMQKSTDADIMFWNGLNMEVGDGWFEALVDVAGKQIDTQEVVEVSVGVTPKYLTSEDGKESEINPHAFLDPTVGMIYTKNIRDGLIGIDPENAQLYEENAESYLAELAEIDELYIEKISEIPEEHRVLITSEHAYQYMVDSYGLEPGYIWEIDTDEQGTPEQISSLISLVRSTGVPVLFVESNVDSRPMETISAETGVPIYGVIYSDELGQPGSDGSIYLTMLTHNITQIHAGLTQGGDND